MNRRRDDLEGDGPRASAVDIWVSRHGAKIITGLVFVLTAWFTLKAQVSELDEKKVNNETFARYVLHSDSLLSTLLTELREIRAEQVAQHHYLCRGKEEQMGCQPE